jgi:hypothetical protein
VDAPPPDVVTAVLRGGPYNDLGFEIGEGETEMKLGPTNLIDGQPDLPIARYRYTGSQDSGGNAIFEVVGE